MANKGIEPRVRIPKKVKAGEAFSVKTIVKHPMETGRRKDKKTGEVFPRHILNRLVVTYGGNEVLRADWHPGVSANPYTSFYVVAEKSGPMTLTWTDDKGATFSKTVKVNVSG